ncbi:MAG: hypothetical protein EOM64_00970 [Erysipelotrichia bacterium]|nr:hypothetical protein [Erysipelotrichia bacterium]
MTKAEIIQKVNDMMAAPTCCQEIKTAGTAWIDAIGTPEETAARDALLQEISEDIVEIDGLIAFAGSEEAKVHLGEDFAAHLLEHARFIKAEGAVHCDCPACTNGQFILDHKDDM